MRARRGRGARRAAGLVAAAMLAAAVFPGCCSCPPAERYFDRLVPFNTINAFVYAVECGEWEFVWDCLSAADRERGISPLEIHLGLDYVFKHPRWGIPIKDIILRAKRIRRPPLYLSDTKCRYIVIYEGKDDRGNDISFYPVWIYLVKESIDGSPPLWRISFEETIRNAR